jgi:lipoprotein-anchoring transpeptidase ErfK/SrfK
MRHLIFAAALTASFSRAQETAPASAEAPPAIPENGEPKAAVTSLTPAGAEPEVARAILVNKRELTAQLQIFLDQQMFSPGRIDGAPGRFVTNALKRWQRSQNLPETGVVDENVPLDSVYPVYTFHTFKKAEMKYVGPLATQPAAQAKVKYLPYASYSEFLCERYHCSIEFLIKLNPGMKFNALTEGAQIRVPNVAPFKIEELPPTGNLPEKPEFANRRIVVTKKDTVLDLYDGDALIASVPIAPGSAAHPTPSWKWRVVGVASMPTFRWDKGVLNRGVRTDKFYMLPCGPNNPVGVGWIGLSKPGIGIHGTNNPNSIGSFASHGCMRTANWDISRLAHMITKGTPVEIK